MSDQPIDPLLPPVPAALYSVPDPMRFGAYRVRSHEITADGEYGGLNLHGDVLLAAYPMSLLKGTGRWDNQGGEIKRPVSAMVIITATPREDALVRAHDAIDALRNEAVTLRERQRTHDDTLRALKDELEKTKKTLATRDADLAVERGSRAGLLTRVDKMEKDLAKVRTFFGQKQFDEALSAAEKK